MDTFCVLPWFGMQVDCQGLQKHCCLLPAKYDIEKIKQSMLAGQQPQECDKCWSLEKQGLASDRQDKNRSLDWYWNRDLESIAQDARNGASSVKILRLETSYTCNATCVYCGPHFSSSWGQLKSRMYPEIPIQKYQSIDLELLKQQFDLAEIKLLFFGGGEPLYERKNFELLQHLVDIGNVDVFVSILTNGSVSLNQEQQQLLSKFPNLNVCFSIDGTERVFEYMRFPLKWTDIVSNIEFFKSITSNISVSYTLSNLNILYHNHTVDWFQQNKLPYNNNPVYSPTWLQPRALPVKFKHHLKTMLNKSDFDAYIGSVHTEQDQQCWEEFLTQIVKQDLTKGIRWQQYLPELAKLLGNCI